VASDARERLRATFDDVAELYDRARPGYPPALFDDLVTLAGLPPGGRILEIGCGTGQATIPLAERGFELVCVELGENLAALARDKLARFPSVEVVNGAFETWDPDGSFDAVVAFTAFHWVDPAVRYEKSARLLRAGGALAVVSTKHVLPEDGDRFFAEVQEIYDAVVPDPGNSPPSPPEAVGDMSSEIAGSGRFGAVAVRRYVWDLAYSAEEYLNVLDTYSGHRSLPAATRRELYEGIRGRIEGRPNGRVRKTYLTILHVARRR
jgi:SAM-dependent methyltransferase